MARRAALDSACPGASPGPHAVPSPLAGLGIRCGAVLCGGGPVPCGTGCPHPRSRRAIGGGIYAGIRSPMRTRGPARRAASSRASHRIPRGRGRYPARGFPPAGSGNGGAGDRLLSGCWPRPRGLGPGRARPVSSPVGGPEGPYRGPAGARYAWLRHRGSPGADPGGLAPIWIPVGRDRRRRPPPGALGVLSGPLARYCLAGGRGPDRDGGSEDPHPALSAWRDPAPCGRDVRLAPRTRWLPLAPDYARAAAGPGQGPHRPYPGVLGLLTWERQSGQDCRARPALSPGTVPV